MDLSNARSLIILIFVRIQLKMNVRYQVYCLVCSAQTLVPPKKQSILLTLVSCLGSQHEINAQQAALKLTYR